MRLDSVLCSFCNKGNLEVEHMFQSPADAQTNICTECVDTINDMRRGKVKVIHVNQDGSSFERTEYHPEQALRRAG